MRVQLKTNNIWFQYLQIQDSDLKMEEEKVIKQNTRTVRNLEFVQDTKCTKFHNSRSSKFVVTVLKVDVLSAEIF